MATQEPSATSGATATAVIEVTLAGGVTAVQAVPLLIDLTISAATGRGQSGAGGVDGGAVAGAATVEMSAPERIGSVASPETTRGYRRRPG